MVSSDNVHAHTRFLESLVTDGKIEVGLTHTDVSGDPLSLLSFPKIAMPIVSIVITSNLTYLGLYICYRILKDNFVILEENNTSLHLHFPWFSYAYITGEVN
jgi:hypothetical protein